jgi:DNA-binding MarR family transcriptional regulator
MITTTEVTATMKAQIIAELENMVAARLFSRRPWLADRETVSAVYRKLIQMGLVEQVRNERITWGITPLGKELAVELFKVFMGVIHEIDMVIILEEYGLLGESEADAIWECTSEADAETLLSGYVKRAYFDYRKARKFLH